MQPPDEPPRGFPPRFRFAPLQPLAPLMAVPDPVNQDEPIDSTRVDARTAPLDDSPARPTALTASQLRPTPPLLVVADPPPTPPEGHLVDGVNRGQAAQYACLLLAMAWSVAGGIALAKLSLAPAGPDAGDTSYTQLGAVIALGVGIVLALTGAFAWRDRATMLLVGGMLLTPGLVVAIVPEAFQELLGAGSGSGLALVVTGAALLVLAPPR